MTLICETATLICEQRHLICECTTNSETVTGKQSQQSDLNRRPSDYKSDALPLCYAGAF